MTTPYTSEPWHVLAGTAKVLAGRIHPYGYEGFPIAWPAKGRNRKEALANARLIAAAPDLLNAVTHVLIMSEDGGDMMDLSFDLLRNAVARATEIS